MNLGIFGTLSHEVALDVISQSDCIIAFGAALGGRTTADGRLLAGKSVIHIDVDAVALRFKQPNQVGIVGDAQLVADTIVEWLDEAEVKPTGFTSVAMTDRLASYDDTGFVDCSTDQTVDLRTALSRVEEAFPDERTLVTDGGRFVAPTYTMLHVQEPRAYIHSLSFGSVGLGLSKAIGASFGAPHRPVLHITGDGGFMLGGLAEFNTAVRHGVDLVVILFNDGAYGAEHVQFRNYGMDPGISTFKWPDFGPVATALGGSGHTVRNLGELDRALAAVSDRDRPTLVDVKIDPEKSWMPGH
jgi:acetolactate synthase-1/2/3 large subunit